MSRHLCIKRFENFRSQAHNLAACFANMFEAQFVAAKKAARQMAHISTERKNALLQIISANLLHATEAILSANAKDVAALDDNSLSDRLRLDAARIESIANEVKNVAALADEIGMIIDEKMLPNGLQVSRVRVPLGVVGMIYESRPNVTIDAAVLALKSGNAIVLKGGKESIHTNRVLAAILTDALTQHDLPADAVQFLDTTERSAVAEMLAARGLIDVVIPRGGRGLIDFCVQNAKVPVIETGASVVHTYVDFPVDIAQATKIVVNEKIRRPSVCNTVDTVLVHADSAASFIPALATAFIDTHQRNGVPLVTIHADETSLATLAELSYPALKPLVAADLQQEWLDYILSLVVVNSLEEALSHIQTYSLGHSESICSSDESNIQTFLQRVDAACVYANASTAFSDGAQLGLGAEIGISTQKSHVRGPFALQGLTTYKWIITGTGQTRT